MRFGFFSRGRRKRAHVPPRVYAIGDIHGRDDLLKKMIGKIEQDTLRRAPRPARIVILGDFVDRGPNSAAIVALLMNLRRERHLIVLKGNHEAAMVDALDGDHQALDLWLAHGGTTTLASFGVDLDALDLDDSYRVLQAARQKIPVAVRRWLAALPTFAEFGRYHFVHAGILPGLPLAQQSDLVRLWGSDAFLDSADDHGAVIVHGHTIVEEGVHFRPNRIGVDTGAYRTGILSAVGLEDDERWVITAGQRERTPEDQVVPAVLNRHRA